MRILHLTPGTGTFHCGSCLRDHALIKALRARGHDAVMAPLYLPLVTDGEEASPEQPVRVGGVGLYLQQKFPWFRFLPRFLHRLLDSPKLLRWAAGKMGMTSARDLGEMTVGSLLGENGRQWLEWEKLVRWIGDEHKPDIVSLSNSLLIGLAPALSRLGLPVVVSLQGEDSFLDTLVEPYRTQAWDLMRENARHVAHFVAPSRFYADLMAGRLKVNADQLSVVFNGLDFSLYQREHREPDEPVIGYLARMIHGKGLTTLVDAFILMAERQCVPRVRLRIGGAVTPVDEEYISRLKDKLHDAGLEARVSWEPNLSFEDKVRFLNELSVFSVPATYGEAFGFYVIEAQACGVPVVQPRHGAFPEILTLTQGGLLCEPDDVESLAEKLQDLLLDDRKRHQLGETARVQTQASFSAAIMAEKFERVLKTAAAWQSERT
ncbi:MAG: glycosyltransferase family 4 protein [Verrucomicrobiaceae bacterium]